MKRSRRTLTIPLAFGLFSLLGCLMPQAQSVHDWGYSCPDDMAKLSFIPNDSRYRITTIDLEEADDKQLLENPDWKIFRTLHKNQDEIWQWRSGGENRDFVDPKVFSGQGRYQGVCLIRNHKVVAVFISGRVTMIRPKT